MRTIVILAVIAFGINGCGTDPNKRDTEEAKVTKGDVGEIVTCIKPPPEVLTSALEAKLDASVYKLGQIVNANITTGQKIEKIRETLPGVQSFEVLEYRFCRMYTNGLIDKLTYNNLVLKVLPSIETKPSTPAESTTPECSPDVLKSQLFRAGSDKSAVIKSTARTMRDRYRRQDFDCVSGLATVLLEDDQDNGHGLYFSGEAWRAKAKKDTTRSDFSRERMREHFFRYLASEPGLALGERDGDGAACYRREKGYCAERTAWINHLMAIDYYQQAQDTVDKEIKIQRLQRAFKFVENALTFGDFDQPTPSSVLKHKIQEELQSLTLRSSGTAQKRAAP